MDKLKMEYTMDGCPDGIHHKRYQGGVEYLLADVGERLSNIFLNCGAAKLVRESREPLEAPSQAVMTSAPEMKEQVEVKAEPEAKVEKEIREEKVNDDEMKTMRVFQLANELGKPYKQIIKIAQGLGIDVKIAQHGLTDSQADLIREKVKG